MGHMMCKQIYHMGKDHACNVILVQVSELGKLVWHILQIDYF